uniref:Ribosomal protein S11 n=1 Tax=Neogoniolithon spectabile TaxID=231755 RepID=A0A3G3MIN6_9FLOR|nr:ribosomal protein S11 [Neogoniolithon spectabile]AYR06669.1 ribosomal protein S11 [Neogoniolithon spectabile]
MKLVRSLFYIFFFKRNNLILNISTLDGKVLAWFSGKQKYLKSEKRLSVTTLMDILGQINKFILNSGKKPLVFYLKVKGINPYQLQLSKIIKNLKIDFLHCEYILQVPHNGCRNKKKRKL